jgi:hypothetical protein
MVKRKKQFLTAKIFTPLSKTQIKSIIENEVLNSNHFHEHITEVSFKTKIHEDIIKDILISYFTNILVVINTIHRIKTKINIYGFLYLILRKGKRP